MDRDLHVYGGFRLSPWIALKVREAVTEITRETFGRDLSHRGEDCPLCGEEAEPASAQ